MPRLAPLNNVAHKDLRVLPLHGHAGGAAGMLPAYPTEFAELQREYAIFLRRGPRTGALEAVVLLGFGSGENLYLDPDDGRWRADYLPGHLARGPFLIGLQEQLRDGEPRTETVVHVDLDHPQASFTEGTPVFLPHGGHSPYLERILSILDGIRIGLEQGPAMYRAFEAADLLEPMHIEATLDDGSALRVTGLLGIGRERLAALDAQALHALHRAGYLEGAFLMLASLHNLQRLLAEKQRRLRAAGRPANAPA